MPVEELILILALELIPMTLFENLSGADGPILELISYPDRFWKLS